MSPDDTLRAALASYRALDDVIMDLTEEQLLWLIDHERAERNRAAIVRRLHQRLTRVRAARERRELL